MTDLAAAHARKMRSLHGHPGQSGAYMPTTEVPWDRTATVYDRNAVQVSSFPANHILNGSVGYRSDNNGRSVVCLGLRPQGRRAARPCRPCSIRRPGGPTRGCRIELRPSHGLNANVLH